MENKFEARAVIIDLMHCKICKGKGTVWNPRGRDKKCECRKRAQKFLEESD